MAEKNRSNGFMQLDGLRGLAVMIVVFSHASNVNFIFWEEVNITGNGAGKVGVWLFFVLSAFLLTYQILERVSHSRIISREHLFKYTKRRILRVYPLFLAATIFLVVTNVLKYFIYVRFDNFGISDAFRHLLLLEERAHFWTIAVELKFYLFIPFIAYLMSQYRDRLLWVIGGTALISFLSILSIVTIDWINGSSVFYYFPVFMCGCFTAYLYNRYPLGFYNELAYKTSYLILALWWITFIILSPPFLSNLTGIQISATHPASLVFWGIFFGSTILYLLWYEKTLLARIVSNKVFVFLGYISFSIYVWHNIILDIIRGSFPDLEIMYQTLLFYVLTFVVSTASYFLIERPFLRRKMSTKIL